MSCKKNYGYKDSFVLLSIFRSGAKGWIFARTVRINGMFVFFIFYSWISLICGETDKQAVTKDLEQSPRAFALRRIFV